MAERARVSNKDILVVGASLGGIEALRKIVAELPADLPAAIFVALHTAPSSPGILGKILDRAGPMPATNAVSGERFRLGQIYVAPPDHHLLLDEDDRLLLTRGPRENRFRPAIDPLFRSAALSYGPRVIGCVLTGYLDDGTAGLYAVKQRGGTAVVQDPFDAEAPSMPQSAMNFVKVDYCVPVSEMAALWTRLVRESADLQGVAPVSDELDFEVQIAKERKLPDAELVKMAAPTVFTCPECHGTLLQLVEKGRVRFRCHTGHAYSVDSLLTETAEYVETSLWNAIRSIQENAMLMRHVAQHLKETGQTDSASRLIGKASEAEQRAALLATVRRESPGPNETVEEAVN